MPTTHYRTCHLCEAMCGLEIRTDGDTITDIRGDRDDVFSKGHICPKAFALRELHEDPDRLRQPVRRSGTSWQPISWEEALDESVARIVDIQRRHGRDAVAFYGGNPSGHNHGAILMLPMIHAALATRNRYDANSQDANPRIVAAIAMYGSLFALTIPDVDRTDFLLMFGANPAASGGSVMSLGDVKGRLRGIVARGGRFVLIDPRRTETAEWASEHHFVQPGGDAALVLSLLHVLFRERRVREHAIRTKTDGLDELQRVASRFSPERVSDVVGMSATTIEKLARDFAAAPRAVAYGRVGVCQNEFGTLASWLIEALNVVTGNFDREGGAMFTTPAADLATLGRYFVTSSFGTSKSRVRGLPDVGGLLPAATLSDEIETEGPGQIRAFVTFAGNPVLSTPNGPRLSRALGKLEFMVSIDPFVNETTRHADIILPPASSLSRTHFDLLFNMLAVRNVAHFSEPIFERRADERHDWEILQELSLRVAAARSAGALGAIASRALVRRGLRVDPDRVLDLALRAGPHSRLPDGTALTLSSLRAARHGIDLGPLRAGHGRHVLRAGGRIDLAPAVCLADLPRLERWVDAGRDVGLVLIGRRHVRTNNSWMHNCSSLVKGPNRATLMMHPHDARVRSIANGDRVVLETRVGTAEATAEVTDHVMRGVVSLPHGYGHEQVTATLRVAGATTGPSANDLTDELRLDVPSATAALNGVPVTVHRAVSKAAAGG